MLLLHCISTQRLESIGVESGPEAHCCTAAPGLKRHTSGKLGHTFCVSCSIGTRFRRNLTRIQKSPMLQPPSRYELSQINPGLRSSAKWPWLNSLPLNSRQQDVHTTEDYSCQKCNNDIFRNFWSVPTAEAGRVGDEFSISFY